MKRHEFGEAVLEADLPATTKALLWALAWRDKATLCGSFPSQGRLTRDVGCSRRAIIYHTRIAEAAGWLKVIRAPLGERRKRAVNQYFLTIPTHRVSCAPRAPLGAPRAHGVVHHVHSNQGKSLTKEVNFRKTAHFSDEKSRRDPKPRKPKSSFPEYLERARTEDVEALADALLADERLPENVVHEFAARLERQIKIKSHTPTTAEMTLAAALHRAAEDTDADDGNQAIGHAERVLYEIADRLNLDPPTHLENSP